MKDPVKTLVHDSGLRYVSKSTGTDFPGAFGVTMSCFVCGKHVPRSRLESFLLAGARQYRCRGGCP